MLARPGYVRSCIDRNQVTGDFSNGLLTVALPKTAAAQKAQNKID
jgi:HSP20 family molecular chaperone IbpA